MQKKFPFFEMHRNLSNLPADRQPIKVKNGFVHMVPKIVRSSFVSFVVCCLFCCLFRLGLAKEERPRSRSLPAKLEHKEEDPSREPSIQQISSRYDPSREPSIQHKSTIKVPHVLHDQIIYLDRI